MKGPASRGGPDWEGQVSKTWAPTAWRRRGSPASSPRTDGSLEQPGVRGGPRARGGAKGARAPEAAPPPESSIPPGAGSGLWGSERRGGRRPRTLS